MKSSKTFPWLIIPPGATLIFLFGVPLLLVFAVSFATRGTYGGIEWTLTLANYTSIADPLYLRIFWRSLWLAVLTTVICLLMGFPLAYVIARAPTRWQGILLFLVIIPFWTNFLVRTYAWMFILRSEGLLSTVLSALGLTREPLTLLFTDTAVLIGLVYGYLPFMVLPLYAALERLDPSLIEAAWGLYARSWLVAASVTDLLFLYLPIAILIVFSFNASKLSARWQGLSLQWYATLFTDQALLAATVNSLIVATVSTVVAGVLGILTAVGLERQPFRWQGAFEGFLLMPIVIPEIMMGGAMLLFFVMIKLPLSLVKMIIAHTIFNFPVVALIVRARLRKLDPRLEEAALDLGATPWVAFKRVTLPLLMPGIIGALLMAFTLSLDDFIISFFSAGGGAATPPLRGCWGVGGGGGPGGEGRGGGLGVGGVGGGGAAGWGEREGGGLCAA